MSDKAVEPGHTADAVNDDLLQSTQKAILTLQKMQQQTAELHRQYLEGQEAAQRAIQQLLNQNHHGYPQGSELRADPSVSQGETTSTITDTTTQKNVPAQATIIPESKTPHEPIDTGIQSLLLDVVSEKTGYPQDMLSLDMNLDSDLGIDSIKRVEIFSAMQERMPDLPVINPDELVSLQTLLEIVDYMRNADSDVIPEQVIISDNSSIQTVLMEIVAEKTGYPADMINLDMNLDTDLGIDSIKRVEILSAFQERMPDMPTVNPDELTTLETLQQILDYMQKNTPVQSSQKAPEKITQKPAVTDHTDILLQVVSEKTGYPVDMIKLDMNLDTDLGIDSIKRVEILSAFQEQVPNVPVVNPDDLANLQTLQQIVDNMRAAHANIPSVKQHQSKIPDETMAGSIWRGVVTPVALAEIDKHNTLHLSKDRSIHVSDDGTAVSTAICDELKRRGYQAKKIGIDRGVNDDCAALVIVVPESIDESYPADILQLIQRHADTLKHAKPNEQTLLACVTGMGGNFGIENLCDVDPGCAAVGGIIKTADKEWPDVVCRVLDIDYSELQNNYLIPAIVDELLTTGPLETGLRQGRRFTLDLIPGNVADAPQNEILRQDDLVVISGGARGITASIAVELAEKYRTNLLLLGRSALTDMEPDWLQDLLDEADIKRAVLENTPPGLEPKQLQSKYQEILAQREIRSTLEQIERLGVKVRYQNVDIRDLESVNQVLAEARSELGPVRAVIHGAGILADRLIEDKSRDQFDIVYSTKVGGIESLLNATSEDELKMIVLFSSSTARFGRKGQCDYAAANEVLNKIAQQESKRRPGCRVLSVNWGPWDGGMVTPQLKKLFESEGVSVIPLKAGTQSLLKELSGGKDTEIVILGSSPPVNMSLKKHETEDMPVEFPDTKMHTAFQRLVSIDEFPVLKSHVMNGRAVLPAALIMEWFAHGAMHDNPGLVFKGIDNLKIYKGVILDTDTRMELQILTGKPIDTGIELEVPLELCQGRLRHAAANVVLGNDHDTARGSTLSISSAAYPQDISDIYIKHRLFHGADLQGLISISGYSDQGISGIARSSPRPSAWMRQPIRTGWLSDPLVVDSAFQLMILWSYESLGAACLPTNINQYRQYRRSFPKDETIVKAAVKAKRSHEIQAEIEFLDREGEIIARIGDYRAVVDTSLNEAFRENRLIGETQT